MAGKKYISNSSGQLTEIASTQTSAGVGNAGDIIALDSTGKIDNTLLPTGIGADTQIIQASEALSAGEYVNIWNSTGAFRVRKADASTSGKEANGFVLSSVSNGANATVYFEGTNTQVTGMTPGVVYLSASTPGAGTATAPSTAGQVVQRIGFATSATTVNFQSNQSIVLA